jgi:hypothetical protein
MYSSAEGERAFCVEDIHSFVPGRCFDNHHRLASASFHRHVGGLFTGSSDGKYPGLAGLKESGELLKMVKTADVTKIDPVSSL